MLLNADLKLRNMYFKADLVLISVRRVSASLRVLRHTLPCCWSRHHLQVECTRFSTHTLTAYVKRYEFG